ncbi:uncharacterized protein METZ01_LOCUS251405, partial [marine metagenome]
YISEMTLDHADVLMIFSTDYPSSRVCDQRGE